MYSIIRMYANVNFYSVVTESILTEQKIYTISAPTDAKFNECDVLPSSYDTHTR